MTPTRISAHLGLALSIWSLAPGTTSAQSFDCANATTRVERMICTNRNVADLDEYLGRYYAAARTTLGAASSCVQADQAQWLRTRRDRCTDASCLETTYLERLGELDALQPGATVLKGVKLPAVPSLVWVIPPAADKVAAPPNPKATPFEATGTIVDDIATNPNSDGVALRTANGRSIPLTLLMFLEGDTHDRLSQFAKEAGRTFRARGFLTTDSRGQQSFEPSQCVFLYRLP